MTLTQRLEEISRDADNWTDTKTTNIASILADLSLLLRIVREQEKAIDAYESTLSDTGSDWSDLVCLALARECRERVRQMCEGAE